MRLRTAWKIALLYLCLLTTPAVAAKAQTIDVNAGDDLQAALDRAHPGDIIRLQPGATFVGTFVLPAKPSPGIITVRSAATDRDLPGPNQRINPDYARFLPKLQSPTSEPAIRTAPRANNWHLETLEILTGRDGSGDLVELGDGSGAQNSLALVPGNLAIDRCYIHGVPGQKQKRGVALNSASTQILNSWISDIKADGQDSQAIAGWNGPGPYQIVNNYLEAAGENFLLGGADPSISNLVPSDIQFTGNLVSKQTGWRGSSWQVKNLLELKNARRVTIENNVFENNWAAAQTGYSILFTPRNQDGQAPWSTVEDVAFQHNVVRHVSSAFNVLGYDNENTSQQAKRIQVTNNLIYDVNGSTYGGDGRLLLVGDGPASLTFDHNTVINSGSVIVAYGGASSNPTPIHGFVFRNNLARHNDYGVIGADHGIGNDSLSAYFPGCEFDRNVLAGGDAGKYPPDNMFPSNGDFDSQFVNAAGGDYHLKDGSRWKGAATDGRDLGADEAAIDNTVKTATGQAPKANERNRNPRVVGKDGG